MSRARRVDNNHAEIASALRKVGAHVIDVHGLPGALDLLVAFRGALTLLEVKAHIKNPRLHLTDAESATIDSLARCDVQAPVVTTVEQALRAIGCV